MTDDREIAIREVIDERDGYHSAADQLAAALARLLGVDIGEHSNGNDPWRRALDAALEARGIEARVRAEVAAERTAADLDRMGLLRPVNEPTFDDLLRQAMACDICGKPHEAREIGVELETATWTDPDDGHPYDRTSSGNGVVEVWLRAAAGSSPDTTPEPTREDYPGQRSTPDACPVCRGRVEVDRLDVTSVFTPIKERPKTIPGRWWCPKGCDPRATPREDS